MQIYKEYGPKPLDVSEGNNSSNYAALHNLTYSQALILLGVPEEEREKFVEDNAIDNMSTRELQQTVNEKNQAIEDRDQAQAEKAQAIEEKERQICGLIIKILVSLTFLAFSLAQFSIPIIKE